VVLCASVCHFFFLGGNLQVSSYAKDLTKNSLTFPTDGEYWQEFWENASELPKWA
jgi:hypothetical protein